MKDMEFVPWHSLNTPADPAVNPLTSPVIYESAPVHSDAASEEYVTSSITGTPLELV
jgi:hypothetical protein